MPLATYVENNTRLSVDMRDPIAEARRLGAADPVTRGTSLTLIPGFGSYSSNKASGSTDTGSGHADFNAERLTDAQAARWVSILRRVGFEAYFRRRSWWSAWLGRMRTPGWQRHIHVALVGSADLAPAARDQIKEWIAGGDGLVGPELDNGNRTVVGRTWAQYLAKKRAAAAAAAGAKVGDPQRVAGIQRALRVTVDGKLGPQTYGAVWRLSLASRDQRAGFMRMTLEQRKELQRNIDCAHVDGAWALVGSEMPGRLRDAVGGVQQALGLPLTRVWADKIEGATFGALCARGGFKP